ncbi:hypothetical protein ACXR6G_16710 [Ancylomarina sp. YFZ004]
MQEKEQTSKQYFKSLKVIHIALLLGQLAFATLAYIINFITPISNGMEDLNDIFLILVSVITFGSIAAGIFITKSKLIAANEKPNLSDKLNDYRALTIARLALLEGPVFFAIISFLLTGNLIFLGFAGLILIIFIIQAPGKDKLINDLELTYAEKSLIEDPAARVMIIQKQ